MMGMKEELKSVIAKEGTTIKAIHQFYNETFEKTSSYYSFVQRLNRNTLRYTEVEAILDYLGYDITWQKRSDK